LPESSSLKNVGTKHSRLAFPNWRSNNLCDSFPEIASLESRNSRERCVTLISLSFRTNFPLQRSAESCCFSQITLNHCSDYNKWK
jgi:hypothetical protein